MTHFGDKLKELRKLRGFSQQELGERLNYSQTHISLWEKSEKFPREGVLRSICRLLNVPIEYFVENGEFTGASVKDYIEALRHYTPDSDKRFLPREDYLNSDSADFSEYDEYMEAD